MNCVIYTRVSTDHQGKFGVSLAEQEKACRDYAKSNGWNVQTVISEVASAKEMSNQKLLNQFVRSKPTDTVLLVYDVSRFSRNVVQGLNLARKLLDHNVQLRTVKDEFDMTAPSGEYNFTNLLNHAEYEYKRITEKVKATKAFQKTRGYQYGTPRYGKAVTKDKNNIRKFTDNNQEQNVIRFVQLLKTRGTNIKDINYALRRIIPDADAICLENDAETITEHGGLSWGNVLQLLHDYDIKNRQGEDWTLSAVMRLRRYF